MRFALPLAALALLAAPSLARDSLGVFGDWGAFRDPQEPRCYAITAAQDVGAEWEYEPFASVGTWPQRSVRGQVHFRLSRPLADGAQVRLVVGNGASFILDGSVGDAWARDRQMDAQIVAEMRAARGMRISARDTGGRRFTDFYSLDGAATALDAASVACAQGG